MGKLDLSVFCRRGRLKRGGGVNLTFSLHIIQSGEKLLFSHVFVILGIF